MVHSRSAVTVVMHSMIGGCSGAGRTEGSFTIFIWGLCARLQFFMINSVTCMSRFEFSLFSCFTFLCNSSINI